MKVVRGVLSRPSFSQVCACFVAAVLISLFFLAVVGAQVATHITPDGTLGTVVTNAGGGVHDITGGTRPSGGPNLYHSFGDFSVGSGDTANFLNDSGLHTTNILSRVTGGNPSQIFGTVQTTGFGAANLFFLNPAGVVFGPNAAFNVGGTVNISTGNSLIMTDGAHFYADPAMTSVLTVAPVAAFGFLGENPPVLADGLSAGIEVQGLNGSQTGGIILVGRDATAGNQAVPGIDVSGPLNAGGKPVTLVSVASPGEAPLEPVGPIGRDVSVGGFGTLGEVSLSPGGQVNTSGAFGQSGGPVIIRGGRLEAVNAGIMTNAGNFAAGTAGPVTISAMEDVTFTNTGIAMTSNFAGGSAPLSIEGPKTISLINSSFGGVAIFGGDGAHILLSASETISLDNSSSLFAQTLFTSGHGGQISLSAPTVDVLNASQVSVVSQGFGTLASPGQINVHAQQLIVDQGGLLNAQGSGSDPGGLITVVAGQEVRIVGVDPNHPTAHSLVTTTTQDGPGGRISVNTPLLVLDQGGQMETVAFSSGTAGTIEVTAQNVQISGVSTLGLPSLLSVRTISTGNGGQLMMQTGTLSLTDGGQLVSSTSGSGHGGTIDVSASDSLLISGSGSGVFSDTSASGRGGTVNLNAANLIQLTDGGTISANSTSPNTAAAGDAGNINLTSGTIKLSNSSITAESLQASGGNITLTASDLIYLVDSRITSSVQGGPMTSGGNITLDPPAIILQNSQILATAIAGQGGNITLVGDPVLIDPSSIIDASSQLGVSGSVNIRGPISNLAESLVLLPQAVLQVAALLHEPCAAVVSSQASSLTVAGRVAMPEVPEGWLASGPLFESEGGPATVQAEGEGSQRLIGGRGVARRGGLVVAPFLQPAILPVISVCGA